MKVIDIKKTLEGECEMVLIDSMTGREIASTDCIPSHICDYMDCEVLGIRSHADNMIAVYIDDPYRRDIREKVYTPHDTEDMVEALIKSIVSYETIVSQDEVLSKADLECELQEFFHTLKVLADNKYNSDFYRVAWNVFQALTETVLDFD